MLSPPIKYLCGWEAPEDSGSASEKQSLLKRTRRRGTDKDGPGFGARGAFGADTEK